MGSLTKITFMNQSLPTSPLVEGSPRSPTPRQVWETVLALALCHNVTPVYDMVDDQRDEANSDMGSSVMSESCGGAVPQQQLYGPVAVQTRFAQHIVEATRSQRDNVVHHSAAT
ncbi:unnamed protein product [Leptidea sinapis]|uniref:Uncharacterized protein n=1 Tax=Leptidea sinapis TaxID=189913 RepID=A0A5E4QJY7_9NEOP|nr:unnamed protein product [Leptidea sinapis]